MTASLAILPPDPSAPNPHGRRYGAADREASFQVWRTASGRLLRKAAKQLGIAFSTLAEWSRAEGWVERARAEDAEDLANAQVSSLRARLIPGADAMLGVLEQIAHDETAPVMARVRAATEYLGIAGLVPPKVSIVPPPERRADGPAGVRPSDLRHLSPRELAEYARTGVLPDREIPAPSTPA